MVILYNIEQNKFSDGHSTIEYSNSIILYFYTQFDPIEQSSSTFWICKRRSRINANDVTDQLSIDI